MRKSDLILPDAPLSKGDKGMHVDRLHHCIDNILKYKGKNKTSSLEPSYYGDITRDRILSFQAAQGIRTTGIYDKLTRQKLREALCR